MRMGLPGGAGRSMSSNGPGYRQDCLVAPGPTVLPVRRGRALHRDRTLRRRTGAKRPAICWSRFLEKGILLLAPLVNLDRIQDTTRRS